MSSVPEGYGATVIRDTSELFTPGRSTFRMVDIVMTLLRDGWPAGIKFRLNGSGKTATMLGKVLVRDDGAILKVHSGGTTWTWELPSRGKESDD